MRQPEPPEITTGARSAAMSGGHPRCNRDIASKIGRECWIKCDGDTLP
jgi:hypothetical protein